VIANDERLATVDEKLATNEKAGVRTEDFYSIRLAVHAEPGFARSPAANIVASYKKTNEAFLLIAALTNSVRLNTTG
jgi:hypothetical protein